MEFSCRDKGIYQSGVEAALLVLKSIEPWTCPCFEKSCYSIQYIWKSLIPKCKVHSLLLQVLNTINTWMGQTNNKKYHLLEGSREFCFLVDKSNMDVLHFGNKPSCQWQTNWWADIWTHKSSMRESYNRPRDGKKRKEKREKEKRKAYIHCLLWARASDYPWSRTLTEHDWSPASRVKFEPKTKNRIKKENTICASFRKVCNEWSMCLYMHLHLTCIYIYTLVGSGGLKVCEARRSLVQSLKPTA